MSSPVTPGSSTPLGATVANGGVNFSVFSKHATRLELLLFDAHDDRAPSRVVELDAGRHRTGNYWHVFVPGIGPGDIVYSRSPGNSSPDADNPSTFMGALVPAGVPVGNYEWVCDVE